ncbi:MAG: DUF3604 domain-containing protein [Simkaniaceae bacterium]
MRRSLCLTEPKFVRVGTIGTCKFLYTPSTNLPAKTLLKFDILSKGREIDWQHPQTNPKVKNNLIWIELPSNKPLYGKSVEKEDKFSLAYEFELPIEIKAGETFSILMGTPDSSELEKKGNKPQEFIQRRRLFNLYIDPKGKRQYKDPEAFSLDVRGGPLDHLRVLHPSVVQKNQRFDVVIRFEDIYNNLTSLAPEGTLIEVSYEQLRENLNWKLFVPETGFLTLPNFYFNEAGIYKLKLENLDTKEVYYSAPVKCEQLATPMVYWGQLHGESERYDSKENIESYLRYFRDEKSYNFMGTSAFESEEETSAPIWKGVQASVSEFNEEDRFNTLLGFTYKGSSKTEGLRQLLYYKDNKPLLRRKDPKSSTLKKIYKSHTPKEILAIPTMTMANGSTYDFKNFTPEFERVVEIYNAWGSSECKKGDGNLRPITSTNGLKESEEGSIRSALNQNHRFGFVAGGFDDRGIYEGLFSSDQVQYSPGLTAIISENHTRDGLMQALYNRCCYATTGARMIMNIQLAGQPMGQELSVSKKPGLAFNRHISGYIAGTDEIKEISIFRNGVLYKTLKPKGFFVELEVDDDEPIEKIVITPGGESPPFLYYYVRALQKDGHIGWSSPIWVDFNPLSKPLVKKKK